MVERPIKKSERQTDAESNNDVVQEPLETASSTNQDSGSINQSLEERNVTRPLLGKDKTKGKGREKQQKDGSSSTAPVNPALMRGPKPTKPKPPVITPPQEATQHNTDAEAQQEQT